MKHTLKNPVVAFTLLTFALSWLLISLYRAQGGEWNSGPAYLVALLYMLMPLIATLVLHKKFSSQPFAQLLGPVFKPNRWFFIAWLLPFAAALFAFAISLGLPGVGFTTDPSAFLDRYAEKMTPAQLEEMRMRLASLPVHPALLGVGQALFAGATINALAAFGEEAGWRGFLWHHLKEKGFLKAALVIGLIWGVWHAPIILLGHNYPSHPRVGVLMMVGVALLLTPPLLYVREQARSVIAPSLLHGAFNAAAALPLLVIKGGNDLSVGMTGVSGLAGLLLINAGLLAFDRFFAAHPLIFTRPAA